MRRLTLTFALAAAIFAAALAGTLTTAARAGVANAGLPGIRSNPIAHMRWGVYTGPIDGIYPAYQAARGRARAALAKIVSRPLAFWFGSWYDDTYARTVAHDYVANVTAGNPDVLAQVTVFRLEPWEGDACHSAPTAAGQASYRRWVDNFAAGLGSSRVAVILQPDIPFALCSPDRAATLGLVAYAARRLNAQPHTTVYIDAGAATWASVGDAAGILEESGVRHVRGFALNTTEYDTTSRELQYGAAIARRLNADGVANKHFVVNTATNGAGFLNGQYPGDVDHPRTCRYPGDTMCVTLGIPPTWDTANRRWGLTRSDRALASRYADGYLWIGRPWLDEQAWPFDLSRAISLAAGSRF